MKPAGKRTIVRLKRRVGDVAKREIFREEGRSIEVVQVCVQWQALVLVASKLGGLLPESYFVKKMYLLEMGLEDRR
jgi:hypothetical protein